MLNDEILYRHCAGGSGGPPSEYKSIDKAIADFLTTHKDGTYKFRNAGSRCKSGPPLVGHFEVHTFTCCKCAKLIQVPMCKDSAHSPNPIFPYTWYQVDEKGEFDFSCSDQEEKSALKKRLTANSLLIVLRGVLCGELIMFDPPESFGLQVGMQICQTCSPHFRSYWTHIWSH